MQSLAHFYLTQSEPGKTTMLALRDIILNQDINITNELKYGMPFFCYHGKMFCYLWFHKKYHQPYIGFVEGNYFDEPYLLKEKRSRMKIMLINPAADLPINEIKKMIHQAIQLYKSGFIKI
jgi:uncharacterized protein YdhG (YjbR/CyaY superfamily)